MQYAAQNGIKNLVDALLKNNGDPNFAGKDTGNKTKWKKSKNKIYE